MKYPLHTHDNTGSYSIKCISCVKSRKAAVCLSPCCPVVPLVGRSLPGVPAGLLSGRSSEMRMKLVHSPDSVRSGFPGPASPPGTWPPGSESWEILFPLSSFVAIPPSPRSAGARPSCFAAGPLEDRRVKAKSRLIFNMVPHKISGTIKYRGTQLILIKMKGNIDTTTFVFGNASTLLRIRPVSSLLQSFKAATTEKFGNAADPILGGKLRAAS